MFLLGLLVTSGSTHPGYAFVDLEGGLHRLSEYRGRWLVVNFWATWCPPCLEELPELSFFHDIFPDRVNIVSVNLEQDIDTHSLREFSRVYRLTYPIMRGSRRLPGYGEISVIPTTFIFNPEGVLVARKSGPITYAELEAWVERTPRSVSSSRTH